MVVNNDTDSSPELIPHDDPIVQFGQWFDLAQDCGSREPSAMNLATVSADGAPQVRVVLLRGFDQAGFCFYTNLTSAKGNDLDANPRAALGFHWQPLARQVRISGVAERAQLVSQIQTSIYASFGVHCLVDLVSPRTLPKTSSGKLSRDAARRGFLERVVWDEPLAVAEVAGKA